MVIPHYILVVPGVRFVEIAQPTTIRKRSLLYSTIAIHLRGSAEKLTFRKLPLACSPLPSSFTQDCRTNLSTLNLPQAGEPELLQLSPCITHSQLFFFFSDSPASAS
ncbi:hypothetical protein AAY473_026560 [Plecturocebus cupreus]